MLNVRTRKVLRDLASSPSRTVLVVLAIAVGIFALSLTLRTQALLSENMIEQYRAIDPAEITLTAQPFDASFVNTIRQMPGVRAAEAGYRLQVRVKIGTEWRQLILLAVDDPDNMRVNRLTAERGVWPPPKRTLALDRSYLDAIGGRLGVPLLIETPDRRTFQLPVVGLVHDLTVISGRLGDNILFGYISMDTLEWLGEPRSFNELQIAVDGDPFDSAHVQHVADLARHRLEDEAGVVFSTRIRDPDKPELYTIMASVLQTLAALGILSLLLSTFLVINTIAGLLARQVPHIGVLKAIGARTSDIVKMYLVVVLVFALLALIVAVPLGMIGARALTAQLAQMLNYDILSSTAPPYVAALEFTAGLIVPLLAALYPILAGTGVTVRQAIGGHGTDRFGASALDQLMGRIHGMPAVLLYALRNMLRRKGRLALTLAALSLGGAIVIAVLSVRASLFATLDQVTDYWRQDITITFDAPHRIQEIADEVLRVPGVTGVDYQMVVLGTRQRPDGNESREASAIFGVAPASPTLQPTIVQGRWLTAGDSNALVVNVDFLKEEPDVRLGDTVALMINGRKTNWQVVGAVTTQLIGLGAPRPGQPMVYASYAAVATAMREDAYANRAAVTIAQHDGVFQTEVARALETQLAAAHLSGIIQTHAAIRTLVAGLFSTLVLLLVVMALLFILVGGLSLTGAMSLNVLERTKEIGVLRAIGASNSNVVRIVLTEGVSTGLVSWVLASLLAIPLSRALNDLIGTRMLSWPLAYTFPPVGILIWLGAVIVLAATASYLPARGATQLTVRDVLAYE